MSRHSHSSRYDASATGNDDDASSPSWREQLRGAVWATLYPAASGDGASWAWMGLLTIYDSLQIFGLIIAPRPSSDTSASPGGLPWDTSSLMLALRKFFTAMTLIPSTHAAEGFSDNAEALFIAALVLFGVLLAALAHGVCTELLGWTQYRPYWRARLLWHGGFIFVHGFGTATAGILASPWTCLTTSSRGRTWLDSPHTCWQGYHVLYIVLSSLFAPLFVACVVSSALLLVDRSSSTRASAANIGRVQSFAIGTRMCGAVAVMILRPSSFAAQCTLLVAITMCWLLPFVVFQPYKSRAMNVLHAACGGTLLGATLAAIVSASTGSAGSDSGPILLLIVAPLGGVTAALAVRLRWELLGRRLHKSGDATGALMMDLQARFILANEGVDTGELSRLRAAHKISIPARVTDIDVHVADTAVDVSKEDELPLIPSGVGRIGMKSSRSMHSAAGGASSSPAAVPAWRRRGVQHTDAFRTPGANIIADLYSSVASAGAKPLLHYLYANFLAQECRNGHLERLELHAASSAPALSDVSFFVFCRLSDLAAADAVAAEGQMTLHKRLQVEVQLEVATTQVAACRSLVLDFWTCLSERTPDAQRTHSVGASIVDALQSTEETFRSLLDLAPASCTVLRAYGDFLLELGNDTSRGLAMLEDAEALEEERSKSRVGDADADASFGALVPFDLSGETLAVVRVSGRAPDCGMVLDLNATALRLFSLSPREIVGRSMNALIPEPLASVHDAYLRRYMADGREHITNAPRLLFGRARGGHIFPMRAHINAAGMHEWVMVCEELITSRAFVWFMGEADAWRVVGVCVRSSTILDLPAADVAGGMFHMDSIMSRLVDAADCADEADMNAIIAACAGDTGANLLLRAGSRAQERRTVDTVTRDDGLMVHARIQQISLPMISSPLHIMRFSLASSRVGEHKPVAVVLSPSVGPVTVGGQKLSPAPLAPSRTSVLTHPHIGPGADASMCPVIDRQPRVSFDVSASEELGHASTLHAATANGSSMQYPTRMPVAPAASATPSTSTAQSSVRFAPHASSPFDVGNADLPGNVTASHSTSSSILPTVADAPQVDPTPPSQLSHLIMDHTDKVLPRRQPTPSPSVSASSDVKSSGASTTRMLPLPHVVHDIHSADEETDRDHTARALMSKRALLDSPSPAARITRIAAPLQQTEQQVTDEAAATNTSDAAGGGGRASVAHSKSSHETGTSVTSITDVLRRTLNPKRARMERTLQSLHTSIVAVLLLMLAMNLSALLVTTTLFSQLLDSMNAVVRNGQRGVELQAAYTGLQNLRLVARGVYPTANVSKINADINSALDALEEEHSYLYARAAHSASAEELALYTTRSIQLLDLVPGTFVNLDNYTTTTRMVNLVNSGIEFIARGRRLTAMNVSLNQFTNPDQFFVAINAHASIRDAFNQSMVLADASSVSFASTIEVSSAVVLVVALVAFAAVSACVVAPAVLHSLGAQQRIMNVFIQVPLSIMRALRTRVERRVEADKRAANADDVAVDATGDMNDADSDASFQERQHTVATDDELGAALHALEPVGRSPTSASVVGLSTPKSAWLSIIQYLAAVNVWMMAAYGCDSRATAATSRRYRETASARVWLLSRMQAPIIFFAAYFVGMHVWTLSLTSYSRYAKAEIFYTSQVQFYLGNLGFHARSSGMRCETVYVPARVEDTHEESAFADSTLDALLYGDARRYLRAGLHVSPATSNLFLHSGCVSPDAEPSMSATDYAQCLSFRGGIVATGVLPAWKDYIAACARVATSSLARPLGTAACRPLDILSDDLVIIAGYSLQFLPPAMAYAKSIRYAEAKATLGTFITARIVVTCITTALSLVLYVLVYRPAIARLDREIKRTRWLLTLFPDQVARGVPAIVAVSREIEAQLVREGAATAFKRNGHGRVATATRAFSTTMSAAGVSQ